MNDEIVPLPTTPTWVADILRGVEPKLSPERLMAFALNLGVESARHGGGPFGAVLANPRGEILEVGWNWVVKSYDSTAHAEILCLRRAQRLLKTHDLGKDHPLGPFILYASCAPCIQCFGAIFWSGIRSVFSAATTAQAEAAGFREGPVSLQLWDAAQAQKDLVHVAEFTFGDTEAPFIAFHEAAGKIY